MNYVLVGTFLLPCDQRANNRSQYVMIMIMMLMTWLLKMDVWALQDAEVHVLSAEALQNGYKESFEALLGISEAKEVELSLAHRRELWEGTHGGNLQQVHA